MQLHFWVGFWHATKSELCVTSGETPKHSQKSNWYQEKVLLTVWWSAVNPAHYRFLNLSGIITSENCSPNWWNAQKIAASILINRKDPILHNTQLHVTQLTCQKLNELSYEAYLICYIYLTSDQPPLLQGPRQLFLGRNLFPTSGIQKILSKNSLNPNHGFLCMETNNLQWRLTSLAPVEC